MRLLAFFAVLLFTIPAQAADPVEGLWLTENGRSVIKVAECNDGICGDIYWIIEGGMQYDAKNPDETKHENPMCGLRILHSFTKDAVGEWEDGKIYKADEGDIYEATVSINEDGTLKVRGYVGVPLFGKSQTWKKVSAEEYKKCVAPALSNN